MMRAFKSAEPFTARGSAPRISTKRAGCGDDRSRLKNRMAVQRGLPFDRRRNPKTPQIAARPSVAGSGTLVQLNVTDVPP